MRSVLILLSLMACAYSVSQAADSSPFPDLPPRAPSESLETFDLHPDFKIELVASEPFIADPVAISFDENGALYVAEMRGYSERREEKLGRIKRLIDRDGDGRMDEATVFAAGLMWPTGVLCYDGGVFVVAAPDLWYFKDHDGDGVADEKRVVLTGFSELASRLNVQQLPNNITWGSDQRIHIAEGGNGSRIRRPDQPAGEALVLRQQDLVLDPTTMEFWAEHGGGQFGMSFDSAGRKFVTSNSRHLMQVVYDRAPRNSSIDLPSATIDIAEDGPAAPVFRTSPDEGWRVARTKWRVAGLVGGPIEGGGTPSGYFTGATGLQVYTGNRLSADYTEKDVFIADVGSNLVHHKRLFFSGMVAHAKRVEPFMDREFLASTDNWFRPVQLANGPAGGLYVVDFYREAIEHPWSLPPGIKEHVDLNRGNDRGRIWRVLARESRANRPPNLGELSTAQWVDALAHPNGWHRQTAARLLFERADKQIIAAIKNALNADSPIARNAALHLLGSLNELNEPLLLAGVSDPDPTVRATAMRMVAGRADAINWNTDPWRNVATDILASSDDSVLFPLLLALRPQRLEEALARLTWERAVNVENDFILAAALPLFQQHSVRWIRQMTPESDTKPSVSTWAQTTRIAATEMSSTQLVELLEEAWTGRKAGDTRDRAKLLGLAAGTVGSPAFSSEIVAVLPDALKRGIAELTVEGIVDEWPDPDAVNVYAKAIRLSGRPIAFDVAFPRLSTRIPPGASRLLIEQLLAFGEADDLNEMIGIWSQLPAASRSLIILHAGKSATGCKTILEAALKNPGLRGQLGPTFRRTVRTHQDETIRELAMELFGPGVSEGFAVKQARYADSIQQEGKADRGRQIFLERCANCHRGGKDGVALGPDLLTVAGAGRDTLLTNILDPNREVAPRYELWTVERTDDEPLSGILLEETGDRIVLRMAGGATESVDPSRLASLVSTGNSLMPEGLEEGLSVAAMADLFRFIEDLANPNLNGFLE